MHLTALGERQNLRERITHALRENLVNGKMRPGAVYSARMLAERMGVSSTPVREAMLALAKQGLVEVCGNKGYRVVELSERDHADLVEVIRLLEVPTLATLSRTARLDAKHVQARTAGLDALRVLARRSIDAARDGDLVAYLDADLHFHLGLLALGGNRHLVEVVRRARDQASLHLLATRDEPGALAESAAEHLALLDLLEAGDAAGAARLAGAH